ncbi:recombinase family protein [Nocardia sp. NBC_00881]|uniref:recombinase family protein n=1 Tax=Nocardia sp. NBC_00881 TaxID=2975995 RepID=UPI003863525A
MRPGDTLVVRSLDRLGRALQDLIAIGAGLRKRGIGLGSLYEALDTTRAGLGKHETRAVARVSGLSAPRWRGRSGPVGPSGPGRSRTRHAAPRRGT